MLSLGEVLSLLFSALGTAIFFNVRLILRQLTELKEDVELLKKYDSRITALEERIKDCKYKSGTIV